MVIRTMVLIGVASTLAAQSYGEPAVALRGAEVIQIAQTLADPTDLWITPEDLARVTGFEIKPEGACLGPICSPLRDDAAGLHVNRDGTHWINATELARIVRQPLVAHAESRVWSFGEVPGNPSGYLESAIAPDFELNDREGKTVRLSDFRGKKVLIVTWASW